MEAFNIIVTAILIATVVTATGGIVFMKKAVRDEAKDFSIVPSNSVAAVVTRNLQTATEDYKNLGGQPLADFSEYYSDIPEKFRPKDNAEANYYESLTDAEKLIYLRGEISTLTNIQRWSNRV